MKKEVLISITGMHTDAIDKGEILDEPIEVITPADYFCKNGKHYVLYDEVAEGMSGVTKNQVKVTSDQCVEILKRGLTNTHMVFEKGKKHLTNYGTPFGELLMGIDTKDIQVKEVEEEITVEIFYQLDINEEAVAECRILIRIQPKEVGKIFS